MSPDFSRIKTHTIGGKKYQIRWRRPPGNKNASRAEGQCDPPDCPGKLLYIHPDKDSIELLLTVVHESLHGSAWHLTEEFCMQFEVDLERLLRRMGAKLEFHPK